MNRIDRLMGIITHLQAKKHLTLSQIATQFEISERTVFRDLKAIGEIGVPVSFEVDKGYSVGTGFFLPPISLTVEEANALSLVEPLVILLMGSFVGFVVLSILLPIFQANTLVK